MMERLLQHGGWLKAFSLALAVLLWAMVVPRSIKDVGRTFDVKLQVIDHPTFAIDQGPRNNEQTVEVRADAKGPLALLWLRKDSIRAWVDYTKIAEPGKQAQVDVQVDAPDVSGVTYSVNPRSVAVVLVENREATFPFTVVTKVPSPVLYNDREWQYTAKAEGDTVKLAGRSDLLNQVKNVQVVLDPTDLVPTKNRVTKPVIVTDSTGKVLDKLAPQQVNIDLTWKELPPGEPFKVQPVTRGTLPLGLVVTSIEVQPTTLTIRAAEVGGKLPEKRVIETEPIDLSGKRLTFTTTIRVVPPPGTTAAAETVNVVVNISEITEEKVFKGVSLQVRGTATNATVTPAVTAIQAHIKGPYSVMEALEAAQVTAYVDVEGLGSGKHSLPVKISAPAGVTSAEADPATVEITISTP